MLKQRMKKILFIFFRPKFAFLFLRHGVLPSIEHRVALSPDIKSIYDVGANKGQFALAAYLYTSARIVSFEPLSSACETYRRIFATSNRNELIEKGIAAAQGALKINVSKADDSSSFLSIGSLQEELFPGTECAASEYVEVIPLSDMLCGQEIERPSLLKIDVQGFEKEVLMSAGKYLELFDYIYCECSFVELYEGQAICHEIIDCLHSLGFMMCGVYNLFYDKAGVAIQGDFLFRR